MPEEVRTIILFELFFCDEKKKLYFFGEKQSSCLPGTVFYFAPESLPTIQVHKNKIFLFHT